MALHTELQIHRTGKRLLALAVKAQVQMPRAVKRILGDKVMQHCIDMLSLMALANASKGERRAAYIRDLLANKDAASDLLHVCFDSKYLSPALWAESIDLLGSIGAQGGGWLKSANKAPAA